LYLLIGADTLIIVAVATGNLSEQNVIIYNPPVVKFTPHIKQRKKNK